MRRWLVFAHEGTGEHYWYDGAGICIGLEYTTITMVPFLAEDEEILNNVLETPRKQIFELNKTRYKVVARGTRYEP